MHGRVSEPINSFHLALSNLLITLVSAHLAVPLSSPNLLLIVANKPLLATSNDQMRKQEQLLAYRRRAFLCSRVSEEVPPPARNHCSPIHNKMKC